MGDTENPSFILSLLSGAVAGTTVDVVLYPLDTLKTRLQSQQGFWKAGGFKNIYSGLASAALGSAPSSALFFCTYESMKKLLHPIFPHDTEPVIHSVSAAFGEVAACVVRVPVDIVKQRTQANSRQTSWQTFRAVVTTEGLRGFYRGYWTTVAREIPFSFIQYPLWELFKHTWSLYRGEYVLPSQAAVCGAFAGGLAGAITTPLDVAKTRIMLAERTSLLSGGNMLVALLTIWRERGLAGLFSGILPRVTTLALGGFIFLGSYEEAKYIFNLMFGSAASDRNSTAANYSTGET